MPPLTQPRIAQSLRSHASMFVAIVACAISVPANATDVVIHNARITTLDEANPEASAIAIEGERIELVGSNTEVMALVDSTTRVIDARGRRVIPGLIDSHSHYLRGGLDYSRELRWDGVDTLTEALERVRAAAANTPEGQWVRVLGGWSPWQFAEQRMPTPEELTGVSPDRPVYVQYFYSAGVLNAAGLAALAIDGETPDPEGGRYERDADGNPTGDLIADPHPRILYGTISSLPGTTADIEKNSTRHLYRELSRYGLTSVIDAGGGGFTYPDGYAVSTRLAQQGQLPLRTSFFLFAPEAGTELEGYREWTQTAAGTDLDLARAHGYELDGAGEYVLWEAGDFENFRFARPVLPVTMESNLLPIIELFVERRWPFRIHATYDESIQRIVSVVEAVNRDTPLDGLRWSIEHAETVRPETIDRIAALGGGVAIQSRMVFLGDDFVEYYGVEEAKHAPPLRYLYDSGIPVGMGTDATRGSTSNPWVSLQYLVTGETASGRALYDADNLLSREEALRIHTIGSAWFSGEETEKGKLKAGMLADLAILSADYFAVPVDTIDEINADLTLVGGEFVHADGDFSGLVEDLPLIEPEWSPLRIFDAYGY